MPQHTAVIEAAKAAGVAQLAYTGVLGGPDADFQLADEHKVTEQLILDSGLPYTFLRNGWYTENYTANLAPVLEHGAVVANAGEGRVASAARADYAAAAAAVLTGEGHVGAVVRAERRRGVVAGRVRGRGRRRLRQGRSRTPTSRPTSTRTSWPAPACPAAFAEILVDVDARHRARPAGRHAAAT